VDNVVVLGVPEVEEGVPATGVLVPAAGGVAIHVVTAEPELV